ncbi:hypothetical protein BV25DRAFT_1921899 [Artomyces pyxidatus]|uniref:Uncharacterized protein n=1 Tax=Artomyces pyxidatus TaxID=48021 RepID=A0ACB8SHD8_9AGAM|nr:hypothetical protein BV25DRAFT_1921899 [Artomyces pyxidatus]
MVPALKHLAREAVLRPCLLCPSSRGAPLPSYWSPPTSLAGMAMLDGEHSHVWQHAVLADFDCVNVLSACEDAICMPAAEVSSVVLESFPTY